MLFKILIWLVLTCLAFFAFLMLLIIIALIVKGLRNENHNPKGRNTADSSGE